MTAPYAPSDVRNYGAIGKETTRGTGVVPTLFVPYVPSLELDHGINLQQIFEAGGAGQVTWTEKLSHMPKGKFPFLARPKTTTQILAYLLGVDTPGAPVSGVTPHVLTDDMNTDYLSYEQNLANDLVERFVDCVIAEVVITCDIAAPTLRVSASWVGCTPSVVGSPTATSYETDNPFEIFDGVFTIDGSVLTNVRKFTLTATLKLGVEQIAKITPEYIVKTGLTVSLDVEQFVTDITAEYRKTNYGSVGGTAALNTITTGAFIADFNYGTAGTQRRLKLEVPLLDYGSAVYTPQTPDATEAVKVTRGSTGRRTAGGGTPLFRATGNTLDASAYV